MDTRTVSPLLLLAALCIFFVDVSAQEQSKMERIQQLLEAENLAEARPLMEQVLREDTLMADNQRAGLLFRLGYTLSALKEHRASINTYHEMMKIVPSHPLIWGNIGWGYYLIGDLDSAIICNEHSLELDKTQAWTWGNQGLYMMAKGELQRMQDAYAKAGSVVADEDSWKPIRADLDEFCHDATRAGCKEGYAALNAGWLIALRRWYSDSDPLLGEDLVKAHPEEYRKIYDMLGEEAEKAEAEEKDSLTALRERLAADMK